MKLVILGTADSMKDAPYDDREWVIWACQPAIAYPPCKRVDLLFELHDESYWRDTAIVERMNKADVPVLMWRENAEVPKSQRFPLEEMIAAFRARGWAGARYYTSTIAYMIAYALYIDDVQEMALYGVHMAADEEYGHQRQAMEYWVGVANGMGIPVHIPPNSQICAGRRLYGYDADSTLLTQVRKMQAEIGTERERARQRVDAAVQALYEYSGAEKALAKLHRDWS